MTTEAQVTAVRAAVLPLLEALGLDLYDVDLLGTGRGRTLRVVVDREGGIDLDTITEATRQISPALDAADAVTGPYVLEVSSAGLERPLRRAEHFRRAVGETVSVKHRDAHGAAQRTRGTLVAADDGGCTIEVDGTPTRVAYDDVTQAHTVFEWGPAPKPASGTRRGHIGARHTKEKSRS